MNVRGKIIHRIVEHGPENPVRFEALEDATMVDPETLQEVLNVMVNETNPAILRKRINKDDEVYFVYWTTLVPILPDVSQAPQPIAATTAAKSIELAPPMEVSVMPEAKSKTHLMLEYLAEHRSATSTELTHVSQASASGPAPHLKSYIDAGMISVSSPGTGHQRVYSLAENTTLDDLVGYAYKKQMHKEKNTGIANDSPPAASSPAKPAALTLVPSEPKPSASSAEPKPEASDQYGAHQVFIDTHG